MRVFPEWFPLDYLPHWALAFVATLVLQSLRRRLVLRKYVAIWFTALVISMMGSGLALTKYFHYLHFPSWHRALLLLPGIIIFGLCAKLFAKLSVGWFVLIFSLVILSACGGLTIAERFNVWTNFAVFQRPLQRPMSGWHIGDATDWYLFQSPSLAILVAALLVWPQCFRPRAAYPAWAPRLAVWHLPGRNDNESNRNWDLSFPQRPLLTMSILELLVITAGLAALLATYKSSSATAFCYTATYLGGFAGGKLGLSMSARRLEFAVVFAMIVGISIGMASAYSLGNLHDRWPWHDAVGSLVAKPTALRLLLCVVLPQSAGVSLLSISLFLWLQALNAKLQTPRRGPPFSPADGK